MRANTAQSPGRAAAAHSSIAPRSPPKRSITTRVRPEGAATPSSTWKAWRTASRPSSAPEPSSDSAKPQPPTVLKRPWRYSTPWLPVPRIRMAPSRPAWAPRQAALLERLPVNANGKLDRKALEALPWSDGERAHAPPATPTEQRLAALWAELLGRDRIGRHDGFIALGGHSLLAVRLVSRIHASIGLALPLSQLFLSPSLAALAEAIDARAAPGRLVVPLQPGVPGHTPLWLMHPAGGTVFCYRPLAQALPPMSSRSCSSTRSSRLTCA